MTSSGSGLPAAGETSADVRDTRANVRESGLATVQESGLATVQESGLATGAQQPKPAEGVSVMGGRETQCSRHKKDSEGDSSRAKPPTRSGRHQQTECVARNVRAWVGQKPRSLSQNNITNSFKRALSTDRGQKDDNRSSGSKASVQKDTATKR